MFQVVRTPLKIFIGAYKNALLRPHLTRDLAPESLQANSYFYH